jgi:NADH-quinone oxidoreductase subunit G
MRGLGSGNVDVRLRQADFSGDGQRAGVPWLGMPVESIGSLDRMLLVGSFLRKDHPLLAARIRSAVRRGAQVSVVHAADEDLLMPVTAKAMAAPSRWSLVLAGVLVALLRARSQTVPPELVNTVPDAHAQAIAQSLASGQSVGIFLGNAAVQHPQHAQLLRLAQAISLTCGGRLGVLTEAANTVGAWLAGAVPDAGALDARAMVEQPRSLYVLLNTEPQLDHGLPVAARAALGGAQSVIALTAWQSPELLETADCLLPITPFTETAGSFVNCEGRLQTFNGVVRAAGQARPAWKVLRVLAELAGVTGVAFDSAEAVRAAALPGDWVSRLNNHMQGSIGAIEPIGPSELERLADVPIYFADPLVRRAQSLQQTRDARPPTARVNQRTLAALGMQPGDSVMVRQHWGAVGGQALLALELDPSLADQVVRVASSHLSTSGLLALNGPVKLERAG